MAAGKEASVARREPSRRPALTANEAVLRNSATAGNLPPPRQVRDVAVAIWYFASTVATAVITASCASALPPRADVDACIPERVFTPGEDEAPVLLQAKNLFRPEMLKGQYFEVDDRVRNDGLVNTYVVVSPYGTSEVSGDDQLRYRENEYEVLGALDEYGVTQPMVFGLGVVNGAENYVEGAFQMLVWPVRSISGVPKGVYKYGVRIDEMTRERRTFYEDSYAQELIGFSQSKRELAGRLGVDPYSTNRHLQRRLNELPWASWVGGIISPASARYRCPDRRGTRSPPPARRRTCTWSTWIRRRKTCASTTPGS